MPRIFRTRFIPSETIDLSNDTILYRDDNYLITSWEAIRTRDDIMCGVSCLFLNEGWKISAFFDHERRLKYWYCDIVEIIYNRDEDIYHLNDLLTDVRITNGKVEVLDLDELADAFEEGLITQRQLVMSLKRADKLLKLAYNTDLSSYASDILEKHTDWKCPL
jgi:predicted RNA-binding protein associated with RNAse of E/G family